MTNAGTFTANLAAHMTNSKRKGYVVALSGGIDSTVLLAGLLDEVDRMNVRTVSFLYPSKHNEREVQAARRVAKHYDVPHDLIDLRSALAHTADTKNVLTGYGETDAPEEDHDHVVPGRNLVFISTLASYAESWRPDDYSTIYLGTSQSDHEVFPDCRPEFLTRATEVVEMSTEGRVTLATPLSSFTKGDVVERGLDANAPLHLTWTCYEGDTLACGECLACSTRLEAFRRNDAEDPLIYVDELR